MLVVVQFILIFLFVVFIVIVELRNDHKEITEKLNENIQVLHSARLAPKSSSLRDSGRWLEPAMHIIIPIDLLGESGRKGKIVYGFICCRI